MAISDLEKELGLQLTYSGIVDYKTEYRFVAELLGAGKGLRERLLRENLKDWRLDFAWPDKKIGVEVEGGQWVNGRHNRGSGFEEDLRKYDAAIRLGWNIYRCNGAMIKEGVALQTIEIILERVNLNEHR